MIVLGIIPARGGSKEVPLKNIRCLSGKPLLAYTIETAQKSMLISKLVVSTDSKQIAAISQHYGCDFIERPAELATDTAPTEPVLIHAVEYLYKKEGFNCDVVLTLPPTSPFRTTEIIDRTIKKIVEDRNIDSVIGVVKNYDCYGEIINGRFNFLFPNQPRRRQERKPLYKESSTIYAVKKDVLMNTKSLFGANLVPIIVSDLEAIDINTEIDFQIATALMEQKLRKKE